MTASHDNRIDLIRPDAPALTQRGPDPVGVRTLTLINPRQPDVLAANATRDRKLVVEHWYPAVAGTGAALPYRTLLRDGRTEVALHGSARRDAEGAEAVLPLVILSHGYPGNRMLLSHLGETLASRGYHVVSIDHPDSTYGDPAYLGGQAFGSTLVNRPLDIGCVMDAFRATEVAIIGYSMGGYGALVAGGAQVARAAMTLERAGNVARHWEQHCHAVADPRLKAVVTFGPWGRQMGLWDATGMARLSVPLLIIAGSRDEVSGYETGMRRIFDEALVERHLLTFEGAGHNAGAPIPAPIEAWTRVPWLDFAPFGHYADAVWDTVRMNNIAQHYVTAFLGRHLKDEAAMDRYLAPGFAGFAAGTAEGLLFEGRKPALVKRDRFPR
ncbi:MAG: alpha/beta fold hydrolase [bacterium]